MTFCEDMWAETAALRAAIHALPFNRELADGTLDPDRFRFYVVQDALYLADYARALALAAARSEDGVPFKTFADGALEAVAVEQTLHGSYLRPFGPPITPPGRCWWPRCCRASGCTGTWAAPSCGAPRPTIPIAPGSTPMPTRRMARPSAA
ncbi:MAG: hypothetical protein J0H35_12365 [Rhodospirillales bacterium]|nr:hypothetical protein [Rhodospirillales bacterium]